jgi:hypothetical protein
MGKEKKYKEVDDPLFWIYYRDTIDASLLNRFPSLKGEYIFDSQSTKYAVAFINHPTTIMFSEDLRVKLKIDSLKYPFDYKSLNDDKKKTEPPFYPEAINVLHYQLKKDLGVETHMNLSIEVTKFLKGIKFSKTDWLDPIMSFVAYKKLPLPNTISNGGIRIISKPTRAQSLLKQVMEIVSSSNSIEEIKDILDTVTIPVKEDNSLEIVLDRKMSRRDFTKKINQLWKFLIVDRMADLPKTYFENIPLRSFLIGSLIFQQKYYFKKKNKVLLNDFELRAEFIRNAPLLIAEKEWEEVATFLEEITGPEISKYENEIKKQFFKWIPLDLPVLS